MAGRDLTPAERAARIRAVALARVDATRRRTEDQERAARYVPPEPRVDLRAAPPPAGLPLLDDFEVSLERELRERMSRE